MTTAAGSTRSPPHRVAAAVVHGTVVIVSLVVSARRSPAWQVVPATPVVPAATLTPATARPAAVQGVPAAAVSPAATAPTPGAAAAPSADGSATVVEASADEKSEARIAKLSQVVFDRQPAVVLLGVPAAEVQATLGAATSRRGPGAGAPAAPAEPTPAAVPDPFDTELAAFRADVLAGRWGAAAAFLRALPAAEAKAGYDRLLEQFSTLPTAEPGPSGTPLEPSTPAIMLADVVGLVRAAPLPLDADGGKRLATLGGIVRLVVGAGVEPGDVLSALLRDGDGAGTPASHRQVATILAASDRADLVVPLLPPLEECVTARDADGIDLWVQSLQVARQRDPKAVGLDRLWDTVQRSLSVDGLADADRRRAIARAAALLPQLSRSTACEWITALAAAKPAAAADLLAFVAAKVASGPALAPRDTAARQRWLAFQRDVVAGILAAADGSDPRWRVPLELGARGWSAEALLSFEHDESDNGFRRDPYGNMYYWEEQELAQRREALPQWPVTLADVLEARPSAEWIARLDPSERPGVEKALAKALGKARRADDALAVVERLAATHRDAARELLPLLIDAWKMTHDPNDERRRQMPFFWYFGMDQQLTGIPLSRSLQERNLAELESFAGRVRALALGPLDDVALVDCFTTCHSVAEVYRPEAIARVFGPVETISPRAAARLAESMRTNLAGTWRKPSTQEQQKTKRRVADIQAEVLAGYATARGFVAAARARGDHWALATAEAALAHDENDFRGKLAAFPEFTARRREALDAFAAAARDYAAASATLPRDEWTTAPFETWLLAGAGACDAERIDADTLAVEGEPERVHAALDALPPEPRDWHRERMATAIVNRLSKLDPAVKYRVTKAGLAVAGDDPRAALARQVIDYYGDLVREIELVTEIDGPDRVGHGRPFGVFVSLRHTREIERESGGFGRYLQNQRASTGYGFNFGRPPKDYRDWFEQQVRRTLGESFEVRSVTFETEKVQSRSDDQYGWRRTPYAYLLLAAKDPKIDRLPPLRVDLDFLDTAGYVVLPIGSQATLLDAAAPPADRPWEKLAVTQILDDRRAAEGTLSLEIRATARGLVPDLETILDPRVPGFTVTAIEDPGVSVARFDPESSRPVVDTERTWTVSLKRAADAAGTFTFPVPRVETVEQVRQRFVDADLVTAEPTVDFRGPVRRAGGRITRWLVAAALVAAGLAALAALLRGARRRRPPAVAAFTVPDPPTPFAVVQLLRDIQSNDGLDARAHDELAESIARIEREYFAGERSDDGDLEALARGWVARARRRLPASR
ncbi:MAG: hypothetical protein ACKOCW_07805 [Planctomycetaceae bacterium]